MPAPQVISLGLGSPASIPLYLWLGLGPAGVTIPVESLILSASYAPTLSLSASTGAIILGASYDASIEEGGEG